ncbi:cobalamin B12-binding domain-containing protein [Nocardioides ferulae]|uniref:cobalamin B12-binding domain-containing protein n=1 Tax=Nocardioides ferulae TaxID=2340821 RepID=UPI000EB567F1|nr:cobalamin B12-binding domain-containing protein [Nocardioides ferulae]
MDQARQAYWAALTAADRHAALEVAKQLRQRGQAPLSIIERLVVPAQARLTELWLDGAWTAEQQKAAADVNEGIVHWLCSFTPAPPPEAPLVVVAGLDGERHTLGAVVVAERLATAGYRVRTLSAAGTDELLRTVLTRKPRAVVVDAALTSSLATHRALFDHLRAIGVPVVAGGPAFAGDERRATALGAAGLADSSEELCRLLETLPPRLTPQPPREPGPAELEARWILDYHDEITPYVVRALAARHPQARGTWQAELPGFVDHLLGCLASSLVTGDETIVVEVREWLARVLRARGAEPGLAAEVWRLVAEPLRGHPLARVHLAAAAIPGEGPREVPSNGGLSSRGPMT